MQKQRQSYTLEFKLKAVELSIGHGNTMHAAQELSTSAENIKRWKKQLDDGILSSKVRQTTESTLLQLKRLWRELGKVKMESDILRKAGLVLFSKTKVKFEFIKLHRNCYPVENICKIIGDSKSGYYYWNDRKPSKRALHNLALIEEIKIIQYRNKKRYGSPRMERELEASGFHASEKLIRKLMKQASLQSVFKRKFKTTTDSSHSYPVAENKLDREFTAGGENQA